MLKIDPIDTAYIPLVEVEARDMIATRIGWSVITGLDTKSPVIYGFSSQIAAEALDYSSKQWRFDYVTDYLNDLWAKETDELQISFDQFAPQSYFEYFIDKYRNGGYDSVSVNLIVDITDQGHGQTQASWVTRTPIEFGSVDQNDKIHLIRLATATDVKLALSK